MAGNLIGETKGWNQTPNAGIFRPVTEATCQSLLTRYTAETYCLFSPQSQRMEKIF